MHGPQLIDVVEDRLRNSIDDLIRGIGGGHEVIVQGRGLDFVRLPGIAPGWNDRGKEHLRIGFHERPLDRYEADGIALAGDRKSTRMNSSHYCAYRLPSSV